MSAFRFRDPQVTRFGFQAPVLVRCPRCEGMARVAGLGGVRRLSCVGCGLSRAWTRRIARFRWGTAEPMTDPFFDLPLWLQTRTRHGWLWAFNEEHLTLLHDYVRASLREGPPLGDLGRRNGTLVSRLPRWIKEGKNREEMLRAIERIRALPV
ncbi:hypothetical protein ACIHFE_22905 [Streptomyces sp. NPDC052396]|uniref:hypothetical protein n=1 Tax=Streptomyces sp. NPDC052396 TaxID=3365689 RepID=UPI0037D7A687